MTIFYNSFRRDHKITEQFDDAWDIQYERDKSEYEKNNVD